ncbi:pyridoxal phosphate-dependent transferase [Zopfochytrium polystomum]|nr:pyridoxal phosphate-dependent transferase [Zopfochytrium polystomum]
MTDSSCAGSGLDSHPQSPLPASSFPSLPPPPPQPPIATAATEAEPAAAPARGVVAPPSYAQPPEPLAATREATASAAGSSSSSSNSGSRRSSIKRGSTGSSPSYGSDGWAADVTVPQQHRLLGFERVDLDDDDHNNHEEEDGGSGGGRRARASAPAAAGITAGSESDDDDDDDESASDEGFDESWADEYPLYSRSSGIQRIELNASPRPSTAAADLNGLKPPLDRASAAAIRGEDVEPAAAPSATTTKSTAATTTTAQQQPLHAANQRNKDSVLHYFVATDESEQSLDLYLSRIIQAFLDQRINQPTAIHAGPTEDPNVTRLRFGRSRVPHSGEVDLEDYLHSVKLNVIDRATRVSSAKMIGHMTSALPFFHRPLARLLAAMNQNVVKLETAATMTPFTTCTRTRSSGSLGVFTSGGTIANLTAMWAARNKALEADAAGGFRGVDKEGLFKALNHYGYNGAVIVGSAMMHYSFKKAADLLGLGDDGLVLVPTDDQFTLRVEELVRTVERLKASKLLIIAIVGVAGTTETLERWLATTTSTSTWTRPGADRSSFRGSTHRKLDGIGLADSITIDGHKQLYTPMGLGLCLFRSPELAKHIRKTANYVIRHDSPDLGKFTLEGSRPATALHLHATLHLLGRDGIESLVTRSATLVRQLAARLQSHPSRAFQTLHTPATNILLYRYVPADLRDKVAARAPLSEAEDARIGEATRRLQARQASEGENGFVSRTRVCKPCPGGGGGGEAAAAGYRWLDAFRVVIANPLTRWEDVDGVVAEQLALGRAVEEEMNVDLPPAAREPVRMWVGWPLEI